MARSGLPGPTLAASGLLAFAIAVLVPTPARASKVLADDPVSVSVDDEAGPGVTSGFTPVTFHLQNHASTPSTVVLELKGAFAHVTRTVHLDGKERREATLAVPWSRNGGTVVAIVDGHRSQPEAIYWSQGQQPIVLAVGSASEVVDLVPGSWATSVRPDTADEGTLPVVRIIQASALPDSLEALVGYLAILVLQPEWGEASEAQRQVLEDYLATGGTLVVRGAPDALLHSLPGWETVLDQGGRYGFGQVLTCATAAACTEALQRTERRRNEPSLVPDRWSANRGPEAYGGYVEPREPLLDVARAPVGSFLVIVLLFAGGLGFGSFALRRRYGPQVLVAFIPLTALSTCSGIATYGAVHEGLFTVHTSAKVVTILDAERHREATLALGAYYAGLAPSEVHFSTRAAPLLLPTDQRSSHLSVDEGDGLVIREGYVSSRTYQEQFVAEVRPTRARLAVAAVGANLRVENALGAKVRRGWARLHGDTYGFEAIADGASSTATPVVDAGPLFDTSAPELRDFDRAALEQITGGPLAEGEFEATLEGAPFMPEGGLHTVHHDDFQYVRGRVTP